jgi:hypothetical protein
MAGVDSAWEQKKLDASLFWRTVQGKMLENGDESHLPCAHQKIAGDHFI